MRQNRSPVILFAANTSWYLYNFRSSIIRALVNRGWSLHVMAPDQEYMRQIEAVGGAFVMSPLPRVANGLVHLAISFLKMLRLMQRTDFNLVYVATLKYSLAVGIANSLTRRLPIVVSIAGLGVAFANRTLSGRVLQWGALFLMRRIFRNERTYVIAQNGDDLEFLKRHAVVAPGRGVLIKGSGVNPDVYRPAPVRSPDGGQIRVLMASRLLRQKGVLDYIDSARIVLASGIDMKFILAGDIDLANPDSLSREEVESACSHAGVEWIGASREMVQLLQSCDICVHPSYYPEGVPKILIEAAMVGLVIITSDTSGCREVVTSHGHDGFYVRPRCPTEIADILVHLHHSRTLIPSIAGRAQRRARKEFSESRVIEETTNVLRSALELTSG